MDDLDVKKALGALDRDLKVVLFTLKQINSDRATWSDATIKLASSREGNHAFVHSRVCKLISTYTPPRLPPAVFLKKCLSVAQSLHKLGENQLALDELLQRFEDGLNKWPGEVSQSVIADAQILSARARFRLILKEDPRIQRESSVAVVKEAVLAKTIAAMQSVLPAAATDDDDEQVVPRSPTDGPRLQDSNYWLLYNGTLVVLEAARALIKQGFAAITIAPVLFCMASMESSVPLVAAGKLDVRALTYQTAALAYSRIEQHDRATEMAKRGLDAVRRIAYVESLDPVPAPLQTQLQIKAAETAMVQAAILHRSVLSEENVAQVLQDLAADNWLLRDKLAVIVGALSDGRKLQVLFSASEREEATQAKGSAVVEWIYEECKPSILAIFRFYEEHGEAAEDSEDEAFVDSKKAAREGADAVPLDLLTGLVECAYAWRRWDSMKAIATNALMRLNKVEHWHSNQQSDAATGDQTADVSPGKPEHFIEGAATPSSAAAGNAIALLQCLQAAQQLQMQDIPCAGVSADPVSQNPNETSPETVFVNSSEEDMLRTLDALAASLPEAGSGRHSISQARPDVLLSIAQLVEKYAVPLAPRVALTIPKWGKEESLRRHDSLQKAIADAEEQRSSNNAPEVEISDDSDVEEQGQQQGDIANESKQEGEGSQDPTPEKASVAASVKSAATSRPITPQLSPPSPWESELSEDLPGIGVSDWMFERSCDCSAPLHVILARSLTAAQRQMIRLNHQDGIQIAIVALAAADLLLTRNRPAESEECCRSGIMILSELRWSAASQAWDGSVSISSLHSLAQISFSMDCLSQEGTPRSSEMIEQTLAALSFDLTVLECRSQVRLNLANQKQAVRRLAARRAKKREWRRDKSTLFGELSRKEVRQQAEEEKADGNRVEGCKVDVAALISTKGANNYEKVILLVECARICRDRMAQAEFLNKAEMHLNQGLAEEQAHNDALRAPVAGHSRVLPGGITCPRAPLVTFISTGRAAIAPISKGLSPGVKRMAVLAKPSGSGTGLSLNNVELEGSGVPVSIGSASVIFGLKRNEAYAFASCTVDQDGIPTGPVGDPSRTIVAASPLPLPLVASALSQIAFAAGKNSLGHRCVAHWFPCVVSKGKSEPVALLPPTRQLRLVVSAVRRASHSVLSSVSSALSDSVIHTLNSLKPSESASSAATYGRQQTMLKCAQQSIISCWIAYTADDTTAIRTALATAFRSISPILRLEPVPGCALPVLASIQGVCNAVGKQEQRPSADEQLRARRLDGPSMRVSAMNMYAMLQVAVSSGELESCADLSATALDMAGQASRLIELPPIPIANIAEEPAAAGKGAKDAKKGKGAPVEEGPTERTPLPPFSAWAPFKDPVPEARALLIWASLLPSASFKDDTIQSAVSGLASLEKSVLASRSGQFEVAVQDLAKSALASDDSYLVLHHILLTAVKRRKAGGPAGIQGLADELRKSLNSFQSSLQPHQSTWSIEDPGEESPVYPIFKVLSSKSLRAPYERTGIDIPSLEPGEEEAAEAAADQDAEEAAARQHADEELQAIIIDDAEKEARKAAADERKARAAARMEAADDRFAAQREAAAKVLQKSLLLRIARARENRQFRGFTDRSRSTRAILWYLQALCSYEAALGADKGQTEDEGLNQAQQGFVFLSRSAKIASEAGNWALVWHCASIAWNFFWEVPQAFEQTKIAAPACKRLASAILVAVSEVRDILRQQSGASLDTTTNMRTSWKPRGRARHLPAPPPPPSTPWFGAVGGPDVGFLSSVLEQLGKVMDSGALHVARFEVAFEFHRLSERQFLTKEVASLLACLDTVEHQAPATDSSEASKGVTLLDRTISDLREDLMSFMRDNARDKSKAQELVEISRKTLSSLQAMIRREESAAKAKSASESVLREAETAVSELAEDADEESKAEALNNLQSAKETFETSSAELHDVQQALDQLTIDTVKAYDTSVSYLRHHRLQALLVPSLVEFGLLQWWRKESRKATVLWSDAVDASFNSLHTLNNWRQVTTDIVSKHAAKNNNAKPSFAPSDVDSAENMCNSWEAVASFVPIPCLLSSITACGLLCRLAYVSDEAKAKDCAVVASLCASALFSVSLSHPQSAFDFSGYIPGSILAPTLASFSEGTVASSPAVVPSTGLGELASDRLAADPAMIVQGLFVCCSRLQRCNKAAHALPACSLALHLTRDILRDVPRYLQFGVLSARLCTQIGKLADAGRMFADLAAGRGLPDLFNDSEASLAGSGQKVEDAGKGKKGATPADAPASTSIHIDFDHRQSANSELNTAAVQSVLSLTAQTVGIVCGENENSASVPSSIQELMSNQTRAELAVSLVYWLAALTDHSEAQKAGLEQAAKLHPYLLELSKAEEWAMSLTFELCDILYSAYAAQGRLNMALESCNLQLTAEWEPLAARGALDSRPIAHSALRCRLRSSQCLLALGRFVEARKTAGLGLQDAAQAGDADTTAGLQRCMAACDVAEGKLQDAAVQLAELCKIDLRANLNLCMEACGARISLRQIGLDQDMDSMQIVATACARAARALLADSGVEVADGVYNRSTVPVALLHRELALSLAQSADLDQLHRCGSVVASALSLISTRVPKRTDGILYLQCQLVAARISAAARAAVYSSGLLSLPRKEALKKAQRHVDAINVNEAMQQAFNKDILATTATEPPFFASQTPQPGFRSICEPWDLGRDFSLDAEVVIRDIDDLCSCMMGPLQCCDADMVQKALSDAAVALHCWGSHPEAVPVLLHCADRMCTIISKVNKLHLEADGSGGGAPSKGKGSASTGSALQLPDETSWLLDELADSARRFQQSRTDEEAHLPEPCKSSPLSVLFAADAIKMESDILPLEVCGIRREHRISLHKALVVASDAFKQALQPPALPEDTALGGGGLSLWCSIGSSSDDPRMACLFAAQFEQPLEDVEAGADRPKTVISTGLWFPAGAMERSLRGCSAKAKAVALLPQPDEQGQLVKLARQDSAKSVVSLSTSSIISLSSLTDDQCVEFEQEINQSQPHEHCDTFEEFSKFYSPWHAGVINAQLPLKYITTWVFGSQNSSL